MKAHIETHDIMTKSPAINAELSGSTTVIACLKGSLLTIAHAGDSAAIIGSKSNRRTPMYLTNPHDLSRPDEVARIEEEGGLVMSTEEYDDLKGQMTKRRSTLEARPASNKPLYPLVESETVSEPDSTSGIDSIRNSPLFGEDKNHVPRIWSATSVEKVPGVAFTRSLGDIVAHGIGVSEKPDFKQLTVQDDDVAVIASDGVTEYLDAEAIIRIVNEVDDPADAARTLVKVSAELWAEKNDYCDDITAIVIFIGDNGDDVGRSGSVERPIEFYCGSKQKSSMSSLFRSVFRCVAKRRGKRVNGTGDLSNKYD